ncbi:MAG: FAD-dependent oxidoreductase [Anaerolineaceae bacterium]|nr:FAD-dependent oxidoreductase [Anaerolineaceae bacterium]
MKEKILVIGAGMAGIMATRTLHDAGYDVTVLEARDRLGGRTHTDSSLGSTVDLGAAWIHGPDGNPLTPLAEQLGVGMGYTDFLNRSGTAVQAYSHDGTPLNMAEYTRGQLLADAAVLNAKASILYQPPTNDARSLKDWVEHGLPQPATMTPDEQRGFHYWSVIRAEYNDNADWDLIDWPLSGRYVKLPGGDLLLHGGGFKVLIDHLAAGLDVRLGTAVTHITITPGQVQVQTNRGTFSASRVILTLPLGVLKSGQIQFDPPLPDAKQQAIQRIGFGNYEKLALRFDKFYWPQDKQRFNYLSEGKPSLFNAWLNTGFYTGQPIITAYHAGRRAREINRWGDGVFLEGALAVMQRLFGDKFGPIPTPQAYVRSNWQNDPLANGSYSFDQVGQRPDDRQTLAEPINQQLFFAGEATHPHFYATVHGAYETGVRAAREVIGER